MKWFLACLAAGLVSACGFAPLNLWPLTLIGVAILLLAVEAAPSLRAALLRGWVFGVGQFTLGLNWIATSFTHQSNMPHWLGWLAVFLLSLYLAVYPAAAAGLAWRWGRSDRLRLVLVFAAAWVVTEYLRAVMFTGFAWNPLGVSLLLTPASLFATMGGTYALSGLAALCAGLLYLIAREAWQRGAMLALGVVLLVGTAYLAAPAPAGGGGGSVRLVQPGIPQEQKHSAGYEQLVTERLGTLSTAVGDPEPRLILWPEDALPYILDEAPGARRMIGSWMRQGDLLMTGASKLEYGPDLRPAGARNSTFVVTPAGELLSRYDKAHLVPYGEYLPMRPILSAIGLSRVVPGEIDYWEGPGPGTLDLPGFGRAGIQICYEIIFSGQVVDQANRPDFIFNPSNDAWFGWWGPPQHFAQARLRAIEEGLPVLRSTPTGVTGMIDARGNIAAMVPPGGPGFVDARIPAATSPTLFSRIGNYAPFVFVLLLVGAAALHSRLQRREKGDRERLT